MRRFIPVLLACAIALVTLVLSLSFRSEPLRAVAVVISIASLCYAWVSLRSHLQSWVSRVAVGVVLSMGALGCAWSGLNVARFYLYNPAMEGPASYSMWYEIVTTSQVVIQWCVAVLGSLLLVLLLIAPFYRRFGSAPKLRQ